MCEMNIEQLAEAYEKNLGYIVHSACAPTDESVTIIERELGIKLPNSLIGFAKVSVNYGNWLASIGPDYDSRNHILNINRALRQEGEIPENLIAITVGYDDDYDCFDTETYEPSTGEYCIRYWALDVPESESGLSESFSSYMQKNISHWAENHKH